MLTTLALALTLSQDQALPEAKMGQVQLVMLMAGKELNLSAEDESKHQADHLKGLQDLWSDRKALTLGPVEGEGKLRGLLVVDEEKPEAAEKLLANDAWVSSGALKLETKTWFMAKNYIVKAPKFMDPRCGLAPLRALTVCLKLTKRKRRNSKRGTWPTSWRWPRADCSCSLARSRRPALFVASLSSSTLRERKFWRP